MAMDYEEYGSSFRTPRPMRPMGGPENNEFNQYDGAPANTEGRPPAGEEDPLKKKAAAGAPAPSAAPAPAQTFTQLQAQGLPRPPAPVQTIAPPSYGGMTPYNGQQTLGTGQVAGMGGSGSLEDMIRQDYETSRGAAPAVFKGDHSLGATGTAAEQAILQSLGKPSRYDADVVKDSFGYLSGAIDDDYNQRDRQLTQSLAGRGLGAPSDGTIGTSSMINQNLARRSAKQNLASELLREQANTYGSDRASAIANAMGFGSQKFGNQLQEFMANQGAQDSAYNRRRGSLQDLMGFGQSQFQNQFQTSQANQQQQNEQLRMLMAMMGYGG